MLRKSLKGDQGSRSPAPQPSLLLDLPLHLMMEILLLVPVRDLIQMRRVCKSIKTLISDPQFAKDHLKRSPMHHPKRLIWAPSGVTSCLSTCLVDSAFKKEWFDSDFLYYGRIGHEYPVGHVIGTLDGLVCISQHPLPCFVVIWNPSIQVYTRLPQLHLDGLPDLNQFKVNPQSCYFVHGFGYDCATDDYKVVAMVCFEDKMEMDGVVSAGSVRYRIIVQVCALRDQRWRSIKPFDLGLPSRCPGKYVHGHVCWPCKSDGVSSTEWKIVSFNLANEVYKEVVQPDYSRGGECEWDLGVLNDQLYVLCRYGRNHADLWVMEEFGASQSWTKFLSFSPNVSGGIKPLYLSNAGEVLFQFGQYLVIYNPKDGRFRRVPVDTSPGQSRSFVYTESLVGCWWGPLQVYQNFSNKQH